MAVKKRFESPKAFNGIRNGVSQAIIGDGIAFISGQISCDSVTGEPIYGTMAEQTERALASLKGIVEDMGLTLDNVAKTNCFISKIELFEEMNEVYKKYFGLECPPARQTVTANIWHGLDVEISAEVIF